MVSPRDLHLWFVDATYSIFDCQIRFDGLLTVGADVAYRARCKVHLITHNSRAPASREEVRNQAGSKIFKDIGRVGRASDMSGGYFSQVTMS